MGGSAKSVVLCFLFFNFLSLLLSFASLTDIGTHSSNPGGYSGSELKELDGLGALGQISGPNLLEVMIWGIGWVGSDIE